MEPLSQFAAAARRGIRGVFTDIDDTLTNDGQLGAAAYGALERLRRAGLLVVPITGRPAGWCDMIARQWPVDAVVGENGALYFRHDHQQRKLIKRFLIDEATRRANRVKLETLARRILAEVPGCALASDQLYREADLAIDFCEDVAPLRPADIDRIVAIFEEVGATAKISSIHVNGWFGTYDKLTMTRILMRECFATHLDAEREQFVFVGDSPNDQPMFAFFPNAIGVANLTDFADRLSAKPRWITAAPRGAGFVELAEALLAAR
ncbi:MAG: HAD-IIB family hydrolase [Alphaproteobacteria bacterium]|nr:HAD-IIB family hydrolase [Alphaproteobacteria bacterium]